MEAWTEHSRMVSVTGCGEGVREHCLSGRGLLTVIMGTGLFSGPSLCEVGTPSRIQREHGGRTGLLCLGGGYACQPEPSGLLALA